MKVITEHNTLDLENLISLRATLSQNDIMQVLKEINRIVDESVTEKNGSFISATYSSEMKDGELVMDIEILCPIKQKIDLPDGYVFKPIFHLVDAVKLEYQGHPAQSQQAIAELMQFIKEHNLIPITPMYSITINEPKTKEELDFYAVEIYIGISENIL